MKCPEDGGEIVGMYPQGARCANWPACRYLIATPVRYSERPPDRESQSPRGLAPNA